MKKLIFVAFATFLSLTSQGVSANCPSIEKIYQHGIFKDAKGPVIWTLTSVPFRFHGKKWVITYRTAEMGRVRDANEAVRQGQDLFNHATLMAPSFQMDGSQLTCIYTEAKEGSYWVSAQTLSK